ncbi:glucose-6-phosphate dehydrogenase [Arthrobacter sp. YN]|uniref:glucose-6-phosphate dehydrogenase n=1 Tax=Arthrobacter sp. YN TaxID=2020486 RepID=UPI000B5E318F|nr:glucose-6-phosphate dehydrogenase [Arthrobacter sp. YN]ASN20171.1 glucose-6-phosphate dehydrogenase [Arthrobacter sp. YN]
MTTERGSDPGQPETSSLVILGASGDLTSRLLLPALGQLLTDQPKRRVQLLGAGVEPWTDDHWRSVVRTSFGAREAAGPAVETLLDATVYFAADVTDPQELTTILSACIGRPAVYFALPPMVSARTIAALKEIELPEGTVLALEKPFGSDHQSAAALNAQLTRLVPEDQIDRVDHFLGNSTVFNLVGLRFANRIFEPLWNSQHIERVDIVYDETLALEGRARYYDNAGALRDMIQSHLLLVMAVLAMEPPSRIGTGDIREAMGAVLRATRLWGDSAAVSSRRAVYDAGTVDGRPIPAYADEPGVNPARNTETLAEATFAIDSWRWAGVPFTLRSGKALGEKRREIVVRFKPAQHIPIGLTGAAEPAKLRIFLGPDAMSLELNINGPGDPLTIDRTEMTAEFGPGALLAYGEILAGILDGKPSLSVRGEAAVELWRIVTPILDSWDRDEVPLETYPAGSA